jgi:hypothetical protein
MQVYTTSSSIYHIVQYISHRQVYTKSSSIYHIVQYIPHRPVYTTSSSIYHIVKYIPHRQVYTTSSSIYHIVKYIPHRPVYTTSSSIYHIVKYIPHRLVYTTSSTIYHIVKYIPHRPHVRKMENLAPDDQCCYKEPSILIYRTTSVVIKNPPYWFTKCLYFVLPLSKIWLPNIHWLALHLIISNVNVCIILNFIWWVKYHCTVVLIK